MGKDENPVEAILAADVPARAVHSFYPEPFFTMTKGRIKRQLGEFFGLTNFGVNLPRMVPGAISALRHAHLKQDEFIYIVAGTPTLESNSGETLLKPGMCAGFKVGSGNAHRLFNKTEEDVVYLEIGDRSPGDDVFYPDDDFKAVLDSNGKWAFTHKDGTPY